MTKKEQEPIKNDLKRVQQSEDLQYNSNITDEDKEVLNNQSEDERKGDYFKDRKEPIDYEGEDLDIPEFDDEQFNSTKNRADESELEKLPKDSADMSESIESENETIYKGREAEKYEDPSKKTKKHSSGEKGKKGGIL